MVKRIDPESSERFPDLYRQALTGLSMYITEWLLAKGAYDTPESEIVRIDVGYCLDRPF